MEDTTKLDVLRGARREYVARGRCTVKYHDPETGGVCLMGALRLGAGAVVRDGATVIFGGSRFSCEPYDAAAEMLRELAGVPYLDQWHDQGTYEETVALFDRAIALEEEMTAEAPEPSSPTRTPITPQRSLPAPVCAP